MKENDKEDKPPPPVQGSKNNLSGVRIQWWHWTTGIVLVALFTFLAPRGKSPEYSNFSAGSISQSKVIAPFDFEIIKFPEDLETERKEASENVLPVVTWQDSVGDNYRREILVLGAEIHKMFAGLPEDFFQVYIDSIPGEYSGNTPTDTLIFQKIPDEVFDRFGFRLADVTWQFLLKLFIIDRDVSPHIYFHYFEDSLEGILRDVYGQGIVNIPKNELQHKSGRLMVQYGGEEVEVELSRLLALPEALERISFLLSERMADSTLPSGAISAAYQILQPFVRANIVYNSFETERRKQEAIDKVPTANGLVMKDELIIDSNIRVTREHLAKLNSLAIVRAEREREKGGLKAPLPVVGHFLLVSFIILLYGLFIAWFKPDIWKQWKFIVVISIIITTIHVFQVYVPIQYGISRYLFPAAILGMLLAILIDDGVALFGVVVMGLLAGLLQGNDYPMAFSAIIVGSISVFAVRNVKTRAEVMGAIAYLAITYLPLVAAFHFIHYAADSRVWSDFIIAGVNSVLSPILVLGIVLIFENIFRITTDLSLLELVDLNRPLLRELALKSPGTYHHSIMVGSLAESASRSIGANALLTRAGAYYHDIGKMDNREYFIENQEAGTENVHDRLPPTKSAEIVIRHVEHGLELAERYGLPPQIKSFITEHHGRSRLAFFYAKAIGEMGESVDDEPFRYPGPNPRSKETGILMLADLVEAATRTIQYTTQDDLVKVVDKLIRSRLAEGDLDDCPLTLKELTQIRSAFVQVLMGIHHQRIPYPDQVSSKNDESGVKAAEAPVEDPKVLNTPEDEEALQSREEGNTDVV